MCRDCLDTSCIEVCPVDCIYEYVGPASAQFPSQLYINPDNCIDCQACEPVCPWEAPLRDTEVPPVFDDDIALKRVHRRTQGQVPGGRAHRKPQPTTSDVAANKPKWGWAD